MTSVPPTKRYSPLDRDEVHADMRLDLVGALRALDRQPGVREAHRGCGVCEELDPPAPAEYVRQQKVVLTLGEVARGLPLPRGSRPVRMYVDDDPQRLWLVFECDSLPLVPLDEETPIALLADEGDLVE
ncbi:hypothetical protein E1091_01495 [Micromonospora fluostatini]|uniref:Uncharacterized protein n=1 Tax=Micromonospora fluostatini TaxID=1629071 RepID=A0ABY2DLI4_9ACTN|nr:hypothetical protein E1091_01495 [Micromonospora fluostatini]